eukprot:2345503-Prymnesium_polylepis.1
MRAPWRARCTRPAQEPRHCSGTIVRATWPSRSTCPGPSLLGQTLEPAPKVDAVRTQSQFY